MTEETRPTPETSSRSDTGYRLEVRAVRRPFSTTEGEIIGTEWQPMNIYQSPTGPDSDANDRVSHSFSHYAAISLAAQWMSRYEWDGEARLVPYRRTVKTEMLRVTGEEILLEDVVAKMFKTSAKSP